MTKVDLITGFLGAGKTTFIKKYASFLISRGEKVRIIENEFGKLPVDVRILSEENLDVSQITGGCMCCTGRINFQQQLLQAASEGYDRIVVEPSGIYDVNSFFVILNGEAVRQCCEIANIITIADPAPVDQLSPEAQYLLFSQLLYSGAVVVSKVQNCTEAELAAVPNELQALLGAHGSAYDLRERCLMKPWDQLENGDLEQLTQCGYRKEERASEIMDHMAIFTASIMGRRFETLEDLQEKLQEILTTQKYGTVYRIKGYMSDIGGTWYELNCTRDVLEIRRANVKKGLLQVIGQDCDSAAIENLFLPLH